MMDPVFIWQTPAEWLIPSATQERITHRSSASSAVCGSQSLTHSPLWPCCFHLRCDARSGDLNSPIEVISECLAHVTRVMTADAIFDFAFGRTGAGHQAFAEDFYHRADTLIDLAGYYGFDAELLKDWDQLGLPQSKIRITRR